MRIGTFLSIPSVAAAEERFTYLRELGFDCCQVSHSPPVHNPAEAHIMREAADKLGVEISAMSCGNGDGNAIWDHWLGYLTQGVNSTVFGAKRIEYVKNGARFAHELGVKDLIIHPGFIPNNPFAPEYNSMLAAVELIARECGRLGLNLLFETGGESPIAILRLITDLGRSNVMVNLDPANLITSGYGNPVDAVYTIGKYIRHMHAKDGMPPTDPRKSGVETKLGEGRVDFPELFRQLHRIGYDRYVIIEREISGEQQRIDIKDSKIYLENLIKEIYG